MNNLEINNKFENIKHIDEFGNDFWYARELMVTLEYKKWDKFCNVINQAITACKTSKKMSQTIFFKWGKWSI